MRIWKCDTNWGGSSILEIFADFRVVFFGTDANRIGHYEEVVPGDLICISQGTRIIAITEATSNFKSLEILANGILTRRIVKEYVYDSGVEPQACQVSHVFWLDTPIIHDRRGGRFYELPNKSTAYQDVLKVWENYKNRPKEMHFDIEASKKVFNSDLEKNSLFWGKNIRYVVPIYQRAYEWGENEVGHLLDDIMEGVKNKEPRFFGSIQVSAPRKLSNNVVSYELIDGQQRLSTLLILLRYLGEDYTDNLRTVVNAGSAQRDWDDFKDNYNTDEEQKFPLNRYIQTSHFIKSWLRALSEDDGGISKEEFVNYIKQNLYFVVIQTKAGISKTIQIFNVINTAGMDLNASDLFKIRFYEYLMRVKGADVNTFNRISCCYQKVADYNREIGYESIPMQAVINFYQKVLVAKFGLNTELFLMSSQRFFEQLFDYLLENKKWPGFHAKDIEMELQDLELAIDILISIDTMTRTYSSLKIFQNFLWETRYGNIVMHYPALACYFNIIDRNDSFAITKFTERIFKKLVPSSLYYSKVVNDVRSSILHKLLSAFPKGIIATEDILGKPWIVKGIAEKEMLEGGLNQDLVYSPRWKNLACKLVEFLLSRSSSDEIVEKRLFETPYDIEHIQSYNDDDDRETIWKEWGWEINGLGNLSMLEFEINRSIHNNHEKKEKAYEGSIYNSIKKIRPLLDNGRWSLQQAQNRRKELVNTIREYILE